MDPSSASNPAGEPSPAPPPLPDAARKLLERFEYIGQAADGMRMDGSIEATSRDQAIARLVAMGVHVYEVRAWARPEAGADRGLQGNSARPLTPADFATFNEQLAQIAASGLPMEHGLQLIADDMRRGRLSKAINEVAGALERGAPLGEAFDKHRGRFPSLYGRIIEAGVRSGDLSGVLFGVGQHQELVQKLRSALWRTLAYPLMVLVALGVVLMFLGVFVMPQFDAIFHDFRLELPFPTRVVLGLRSAAPYIAMILIALVFGIPACWALLKMAGRDRAAMDRLVVPLPVIGSVFRLSMIARWCDALRIGVSAGLDLPAAIDLAGDAVGSPKLCRDGAEIKKTIESGAPFNDQRRRRMIPATIPAAIGLSAGHNTLARTLDSLSHTYRRQAEMRVAALPVLLTPLTVIVTGAAIGFVILALFMPLISVTRGHFEFTLNRRNCGSMMTGTRT